MRDSHTIIPTAKPLFHVFLTPASLPHLLSLFLSLAPRVSAPSRPAQLEKALDEAFSFSAPSTVPNLPDYHFRVALSSLQSQPSILSRVSRGKSRGKLAAEDPTFLTPRSLVTPRPSVRLSRSWMLSRISYQGSIF